MVRRTVRIRIPNTRGLTRQIRKEISSPRSRGGRALAGHIAHRVFTENLKDFDAKSDGGSDRYGDQWKPLAPSTVRRKLSKRASSLPKRKRVRYQKLLTLFSAQAALGTGLTPSEARRVARRAALVAVGASGLVQINVETGRLRRSLSPGSLNAQNGVYRPKRDQLVVVDDGSIRLGTKVPYSKYVDKQRPIFPSAARIRPWVRAAVAAAMPIVIQEAATKQRGAG